MLKMTHLIRISEPKTVMPPLNAPGSSMLFFYICVNRIRLNMFPDIIKLVVNLCQVLHCDFDCYGLLVHRCIDDLHAFLRFCFIMNIFTLNTVIIWQPTEFLFAFHVLFFLIFQVTTGVNSSKIKKLLFSMALSSKSKELKRFV